MSNNISEFVKKASKTIKKQAETKEVNIEDEYCKHAKRRRCLALKLVFLNKKGFPDRTTLCPKGRILFIEFKRKDISLSGLQNKIRKMLVSFGFEYYVCDKLGQAEKILDDFLGRT